MPNLIVTAVSEWNGKALKKGQKDINAFEKGVNKLGKSLALVFGARAIYRFGKDSVQAFLADEAAATKLSSAVNNLGLSLSNTDIAGFIGKLEKQSGVLDDVLRPSFQALLTTTGDVSKSQKLLTSAIDISRGSSQDLSTVSQDLANAYVGITRGLKKYNLGLTQTQLKAASFEEIMVLLNKQFKGASAAYLATYAGKLETLKGAADRSKEAIGKGLVDALTLAAGKNGDIQDVADSMENLASFTADATRGVGALIGKITTLGGLIPKDMNFKDTIGYKLFDATSIPRALARLGKESRPKAPATGASTIDDYNAMAKQKQAATAKALADKKALAIQKELNKAAIAKALADKKAAQAAKVALLFNQTAISATAALKNKLTDEERNKVLLMLALEMDNTKEAEKLAQKVALASDETGLLAQFLRTLPDAKNPFAAWDTYLSTLKEDSLAAAQAVAEAWRKAYADEARQSAAKTTNKGFDNFQNLSVTEQISLIDQATVDALAAAAAADAVSKDVDRFLNQGNTGGASAPTFNTGSGNYGGLGGAGQSGGGGATVMNYNITINNPVGDGIESMVQDAVLNASRLGNNLTPAGYLA
jgi:hypothetical protein